MIAPATVPIHFELPERWTPADPAHVEASGAAYVALREDLGATFTPNITVTSGNPTTRGGSLVFLADYARDRLRSVAASVQLTSRRIVDGGASTGFTHSIRLTVGGGAEELHLAQAQAAMVLVDPVNPALGSLYLFALTASLDDFEIALPDFQQCIRSLRLVENSAGGAEGS